MADSALAPGDTMAVGQYTHSVAKRERCLACGQPSRDDGLLCERHALDHPHGVPAAAENSTVVATAWRICALSPEEIEQYKRELASAPVDDPFLAHDQFAMDIAWGMLNTPWTHEGGE